MLMPGRKYSSGKYRYGFNGKENDNEVKGDGNEQDYGMRVYDARVGRFLSFDPLSKEYSDLSPYHFAGNNPIQNLDRDGGEPLDYTFNWQYRRFSINSGEPVFTRVVTNDPQLGTIDVEAVYDKWSKQTWFIHQGNDGKNYYWKHNPGADQTIRMVGNGKWEEFKTRQRIDYEQTIELTNGIAAFFAGAVSTPFAFAAASGITAAVSTSVVATYTNIGLAVYRNLPLVGATGRILAEVMDESGSLASGSSGGVKLAETIFQEGKGMLGAAFKMDNGKTLDFLANKVVNGKTLELTDAILYPQGVKGNEMAGEFKGAIGSILDKLKEYAKSQGFEKLRITYTRVENSSSANPGHSVDKTFDLNQ